VGGSGDPWIVWTSGCGKRSPRSGREGAGIRRSPPGGEGRVGEGSPSGRGGLGVSGGYEWRGGTEKVVRDTEISSLVGRMSKWGWVSALGSRVQGGAHPEFGEKRRTPLVIE
jgi:hypothetical protein